MSDVSVSISLTKKQQGDLYMKAMRQADRIKELKAGLRRIVTLAEENQDFAVVTAAKALLEPSRKPE